MSTQIEVARHALMLLFMPRCECDPPKDMTNISELNDGQWSLDVRCANCGTAWDIENRLATIHSVREGGEHAG